jgi:pilus assembly protein CpaB
MKVARLVVLTIAIGAGGVAAMLSGKETPAPPPPAPVAQMDVVDLLVAKTDIPIGRAITAQDVEWQTWPVKAASPQFTQKANNPNAIAQIVGSVPRVSFASGEPIREDKLIKATGSGYMAAVLPVGMRAISTEITPETGAAGFILPNDRVDVILTSADRVDGKENYKSRTILTDVRVLAIDQTIEEKNGQRTVMGKIATLEVAPSNAEKLSLARRLGSISLVLRGLAEQGAAGTATESSLTSGDTITIVRFGQQSTQ